MKEVDKMSEKEIREALMEGNTGEYTHMIISRDAWDNTYSISYVGCEDDVERRIASIKAGGSVGMYSIVEVYNYSLDLDEQLAEERAYHIEPKSEKKGDFLVSKMLEKAVLFATKAHGEQLRKSGEPYITHPLSVVENVYKYKKSKNLDTLLIAACLHDTLEDTDVSYYDIVKEFGPQIAALVLELTNDEDMKNILGKECYLSIKMKNMSSWALVIKLCDRLDNLKDLSEREEEFKIHYMSETIGILDSILRYRSLSKTHVAIIEKIISLLLQLCRASEKQKVIELSTLCEELKKGGSSPVYSALCKRAWEVGKNDANSLQKRLLELF